MGAYRAQISARDNKGPEAAVEVGRSNPVVVVRPGIGHHDPGVARVEHRQLQTRHRLARLGSHVAYCPADTEPAIHQHLREGMKHLHHRNTDLPRTHDLVVHQTRQFTYFRHWCFADSSKRGEDLWAKQLTL